MKLALQTQLKSKAQASGAFSPPKGGLLQRKCACGGTPGVDGECAECRQKHLQRKASSRSVPGDSERLSRIPVIQPKLTIGMTNDPLEQEADRVADQVLMTSAHPAVSDALPRIQRFTRQSTEGMSTAPPSVDCVLASSGRPLEPALRQNMEQRFGHDFSKSVCIPARLPSNRRGR